MDKTILLSHGDGGALTRELVQNIFLRHLDNDLLRPLSDSALLPGKDLRLAFTTDSFVVDPIFFPGGDIGKLAVCGTVNDLAVCGARPRHMSAAFILEEGLPLGDLEKIIASMARWCRESNVSVVTGDTKVVPRGRGDKIYISTAGIGYIDRGTELGAHKIKPGDKVLVNGSLGHHGLAVLAARENMSIEGIISDCAPLQQIISLLLECCPGVRAMRDLTRGGLATALKEMALEAGVDIVIEESSLPFNPRVSAAAEILGLDLLYMANEGRFMAILDSRESPVGLAALQAHPLGREARVIGEVRPGKGNIFLKTALGGTRTLNLLLGMPLPRIC